MTTTTRILAIFDTFSAAADAVQDLLRTGFDADAVSVLFADSPDGRAVLMGDYGNVGESAKTGGVIGGALGAVATSVLALPALGVLALGPITALLAGVGVGAVSGTTLGALVGLGIPEHEAAARLREIESGSVLVAVDVEPHRVEAAKAILEAHDLSGQVV